MGKTKVLIMKCGYWVFLPCQLSAYTYYIYFFLFVYLSFSFCVSLIRLNVKMEQILTKLGLKIEALRANSPHPRQYLLWAID